MGDLEGTFKYLEKLKLMEGIMGEMGCTMGPQGVTEQDIEKSRVEEANRQKLRDDKAALRRQEVMKHLEDPEYGFSETDLAVYVNHYCINEGSCSYTTKVKSPLNDKYYTYSCNNDDSHLRYDELNNTILDELAQLRELLLKVSTTGTTTSSISPSC